MKIRLRRGLDLALAGAPEQRRIETCTTRRVALVMDDYDGLRPVPAVAVGDRVALGQPLVTDRRHPEVACTAFAAGTVREIERGPGRRIRHVVIDRDGNDAVDFPQHDRRDLARLAPAELRRILLASGAWTALRARPFERVASPEVEPRALFVTAIDTNPLAPDPAVVLAGRHDAFRAGLAALGKLTAGTTWLCVAAGDRLPMPEADGILRAEFDGPHPAGLPGTHIHAVGPPLGLEPDLWHIGYQDVAAIGELLLTGRPAPERVVAVGGPGARRPGLRRMRLGSELAADALGATGGPCRIVSGSVLSGRGPARFLGRYHQQVTLLPERETRLHGWPGGMLPNERFERVWPFRNPPMPLLRALLAGDADAAERLGCLGLAAEDLALLSYVCPAKNDYAGALAAVLRAIEHDR